MSGQVAGRARAVEVLYECLSSYLADDGCQLLEAAPAFVSWQAAELAVCAVGQFQQPFDAAGAGIFDLSHLCPSEVQHVHGVLHCAKDAALLGSFVCLSELRPVQQLVVAGHVCDHFGDLMVP